MVARNLWLEIANAAHSVWPLGSQADFAMRGFANSFAMRAIEASSNLFDALFFSMIVCHFPAAVALPRFSSLEIS